MKVKKIKDGRLQTKHSGGFLIITPEVYDSPIPLYCPLCKGQMKNVEDSKYYREFECCVRCGIEYAEGNREKWENGWRPILSKNK